jgi:hypothetical protein
MQDILYRIRNSLSFASISAIAIGAGMALIGIFVPLGWPHTPVSVARTLTYVGLGLVLLGIILAVLRNSKNPIEKTKRVYGIISILTNMENRLWRLAEKRDAIDFDWKRYEKTCQKIIRLLGVTEPNATTINDAKKQVINLASELKERVFISDRTLAQKVEKVRSISRLLDKDGFGLKKQKGLDRIYLRLNGLVNKYYDDYKDIVDDELDTLIKSHRDAAEAGANTSLVKQRILYLVELTNSEDLFSPSMQSNLEGLETDVKDWLIAVRIKISQHITTISSKKT